MTVDRDPALRIDSSSSSAEFSNSAKYLASLIENNVDGTIYEWEREQESGRKVYARVDHISDSPEPFCRITFGELKINEDHSTQSSSVGLLVRRRVMSQVARQQAVTPSVFVGSSAKDIAHFVSAACKGMEAGLDPLDIQNLTEEAYNSSGPHSTNNLASPQWAEGFRHQFAARMGVRLFANS